MIREARGRRAVIVVALAATALGCAQDRISEKTRRETPKGSGIRAPRPEQVEVASPFSGFDKSSTVAQLAGVWLIAGGTADSSEVWDVVEDEVLLYDGKNEHSALLTAVSPCMLRISEEKGGGRSIGFYRFAWDGDTLWTGSGAAGARAGDDIYLCDDDVTYVISKKGCSAWANRFDAWEALASSCSVTRDAATFRFVVDGRELSLAAKGASALVEEPLMKVGQHFDDLAEAKEALAKVKLVQ